MVELEKQNTVPGQQEDQEDQQVRNLDAHGQHLLERDALHFMRGDPGRKEKIADQGGQVEQLEGF